MQIKTTMRNYRMVKLNVKCWEKEEQKGFV